MARHLVFEVLEEAMFLRSSKLINLLPINIGMTMGGKGLGQDVDSMSSCWNEACTSKAASRQAAANKPTSSSIA